MPASFAPFKEAIRKWLHGLSSGVSRTDTVPDLLASVHAAARGRRMIKSVTFLHPEGHSTCESRRSDPAMLSASLPFQNAELPVRALQGAGGASTPTPPVTKGTAS